MQQQMKLYFSGIIVLLFSIFSCTQNAENNSIIKKDSTMPATTGRLLTVISLDKNDDGTIIEVTFLESPALFEFTLTTTQDSLMYELLSNAEAKQLPVNVFITTEQNRNIIKKVLPATDEQIRNYLKDKSRRKPAKPVPKPDGM